MIQDQRKAPRSRLMRFLRAVLVVVAALTVTVALAALSSCRTMGKAAEGARLERMEQSPQWGEGQFKNRRDQTQMDMADAMRMFLFEGSDHREPDPPIKARPRVRSDFEVPPSSGLRVTWLGHSNLLVEIDGRRVLIDPVWGELASPFTFAGPRRFYPPPLPLDELPDVDAIIISHDHYDHLDTPSVDALKTRDITWFVPLGVGAHLEYWGVDARRIVELDWWESREHAGLTITCTPSRHFSGRTLPGTNGGPTLWAGWTVKGEAHNVYYSGDTALFDELVDIGARLGPFDLTMIEAGAYNQAWADVHLGPEQAVRAHRLVKGEVMLPVHWGMFDLALHGWTEPAERVLRAAEKENVRVVTPGPGDWVEPSAGLVPNATTYPNRWWPAVPWVDAAAAPVHSSGVDHLMADDAVR